MDSRYERCPVPDPAGLDALDPAFYTRMKPIYDDYVAHSNPVATNVTVPWAYRLLFSQGWVKQAF